MGAAVVEERMARATRYLTYIIKRGDNVGVHDGTRAAKELGRRTGAAQITEPTSIFPLLYTPPLRE